MNIILDDNIRMATNVFALTIRRDFPHRFDSEDCCTNRRMDPDRIASINEFDAPGRYLDHVNCCVLAMNSFLQLLHRNLNPDGCIFFAACCCLVGQLIPHLLSESD